MSQSAEQFLRFAEEAKLLAARARARGMTKLADEAEQIAKQFEDSKAAALGSSTRTMLIMALSKLFMEERGQKT